MRYAKCVIAGWVLFIAGASAKADLVADYRFQNSFASSVPGAPDLVPVGTGSSAFINDNVETVPAVVWSFSADRGLRLPLSGLLANPEVYTLVVLFRFDTITPDYLKVVDTKDGVADDGLYVLDAELVFYPFDVGSHDMAANSYMQVVFRRDASGTLAALYGSGPSQLGVLPQFSVNDTEELGVIENALRFFIDDETNGDEESGGAVARIRVFDTALSNADLEFGPPLGRLHDTVFADGFESQNTDAWTRPFPPPTVMLTVGNGSPTELAQGSVNGSGIACPADCSEDFAPGTGVTLTAVPASFCTFQEWIGACQGQGPTCNINIGSAPNQSTKPIFNC